MDLISTIKVQKDSPALCLWNFLTISLMKNLVKKKFPFTFFLKERLFLRDRLWFTLIIWNSDFHLVTKQGRTSLLHMAKENYEKLIRGLSWQCVLLKPLRGSLSWFFFYDYLDGVGNFWMVELYWLMEIYLHIPWTIFTVIIWFYFREVNSIDLYRRVLT